MIVCCTIDQANCVFVWCWRDAGRGCGWQIGMLTISQMRREIESRIYMKNRSMDGAMKDTIQQEPCLSLDRFEFYDIWLLLSLGIGKKGSNLKGIVASGDRLNHAAFTLDELNYGMSKLIYNGFVKQEKRLYCLTNKARDFLAKNEKEHEGCIENLFRLAPIFQLEHAEQGCQLIAYFSQEEYEAVYKPNRLIVLLDKLMKGYVNILRKIFHRYT